MAWLELKNEAARMLFEKDALHIYFAAVMQVVAALWTRRSLGDWRPWFAVLAIEIINEGFDIARGGEPALMRWQVVSAVHDFINTMIIPTVLLLLVRSAGELFRWGRLNLQWDLIPTADLHVHAWWPRWLLERMCLREARPV